ncbi:hypothetical protein BOSE62_80066 [Bosea sp. 62]|nr:hypothetical protein BOSE46_80065 [Bosea sp. 46]VXC69335.1 hypothetical protein BOSE29B_70066 [Bosea sp. 29B]VXC95665.1 hypothetical protein BOSE62_80066 [Bosea sp. 62]
MELASARHQTTNHLYGLSGRAPYILSIDISVGKCGIQIIEVDAAKRGLDRTRPAHL